MSDLDTQRYALSLLVEPDADVRRMTIDRLRESGRVDDPEVGGALIRVLRDDPSDAPRGAAVRALRTVGGETLTEELLAVLSAPASSRSPRAPGPKLRRELLAALADPQCAAHGSEALHARLRDQAMERLATDPDRDVRIEAARVLGHYASRESLMALVSALRQADFGVVYEAGRSLHRLTGERWPSEPGPWEAWLSSTADPFAHRPSPEIEQPSRGSWGWFGRGGSGK